MSLRGRLVAGVVALVAAGLVVFDVATYLALRSFLVGRVDDQLRAARSPVAEEMVRGVTFPGRRPKVVIPVGTYALLVDHEGRRVATLQAYRDESDPPPDLPEDLGTGGGGSGDGGGRLFGAGAAGGDGPRYRVLASPLAEGGTLVVALPLRDVDQTLDRLTVVQGTVSLAVLIGLGLLARWVVGIGLRPLDQIAGTAAAIGAGDLGRRVEPAEERTEVGRLGLALNAMLAQIESAFAERAASEERLRRFVADASHELRTPLTSIRGYAELFRRGAADRPEDLAVAMRRIEQEAARMGVLVDDLLLLARLDAGRPLERAPVDLARVAADAAADARAVSPEHPVTVDARGPVVVEGDEARLRQVAANLLHNARVHTPPGTRVTARARAAGGRAVLEVADEGPGLAPEQAARVFERFYRADPSRSRASGGSGLGLSIVAAIAAAHGGEATVESTPGAGATFRITLPLAAGGGVGDQHIPDQSGEATGGPSGGTRAGRGTPVRF